MKLFQPNEEHKTSMNVNRFFIIISVTIYKEIMKGSISKAKGLFRCIHQRRYH